VNIVNTGRYLWIWVKGVRFEHEICGMEMVIIKMDMMKRLESTTLMHELYLRLALTNFPLAHPLLLELYFLHMQKYLLCSLVDDEGEALCSCLHHPSLSSRHTLLASDVAIEFVSHGSSSAPLLLVLARSIVLYTKLHSSNLDLGQETRHARTFCIWY
jgi:hypothetical protein